MLGSMFEAYSLYCLLRVFGRRPASQAFAGLAFFRNTSKMQHEAAPKQLVFTRAETKWNDRC